jgi:hypothetical protein
MMWSRIAVAVPGSEVLWSGGTASKKNSSIEKYSSRGENVPTMPSILRDSTSYQ